MIPAISVIVPVYNVAPYLCRSVDSVLQQTFPELEILLIDDGSTDASGSICKKYAAKDRRVRVIHKENGGPSNARNVGMQEAKGQYFAFVDGDDYIELDMMERQYELAQKYQADVVCCGYGQQQEPGPLTPPKRREVSVCAWEEFALGLLQGDLYYTSFCNKLYRQELAVKLRNDGDICFTEDRLANCYGLRGVKRIVMDNVPRYHYITRSGSLAQHSLSERQFTALEASRQVIDMMRDEPALLPYCIRQKDIILMTLITRIIKADCFGDRYPALRAEILEDYRAIIRSGLYNRKEKLTAFLLRYMPWAYKIVVKAAAQCCEKAKARET